MARPRSVLQNKLYLATRRSVQRQFLLRPSKRVNQAVLYCLAEAAQHFGVRIMWIVAMSNHLHEGVDDPDGKYPLFLRRFHRTLAKVLNCHWGRKGSLFEDKQTSMVELADADAVFDKMIYSLTNPVKDHLVKRADEWPGVTSLQAQLDNEELVCPRPTWFFRDSSKMPEVVRLRFHRPKPFAHLSQRAWAKKIRAAVAERERAARKERRCSDRQVLGAPSILAQSFLDFPKTPEPPTRISPRVATKDERRRVEVLRRNRAWLRDYRAARQLLGNPDVSPLFPPGTWKLWRERLVHRLPEV